ncbi:AmmeMemoRadiSam system protein B, partial [Candidatus Woesearchaeota archaeon]|nr:AmmeMemoRadiSam system protein B [Candidatus Woesearchaeota archaeon]
MLKNNKQLKQWIAIGGVVCLLVLLLVGWKLGWFGHEQTPKRVVIRPPAVAGTWYPGTQQALENTVAGFLNSSRHKLTHLKALIVPHAGYRFSGIVAGQGYSVVPPGFSKVVVIGLSHHYPFTGISIFNGTHYQTPLGLVKVSRDVWKLLSEDGVAYYPQAHKNEHSIEIQLPFLQRVLGEFELVPILTSRTDPKWLASLVEGLIDERTLVVVSTDLSHYKPYDTANMIDNNSIEAILELNITKFWKEGDACNKIGVLTIMQIAKDLGWKPVLISYKNSGDTYGDKARGVVGYASIAFVKEGLTQDEQQFLLKFSRDTLESIYNKSVRVSVDESKLSPALKQKQGCFVTLNKHGMLRGCIGHILPQEELWKCVRDNTINAALYDRRFEPVTQEELGDIEIEISVLSVPQPLNYTNAEDLLSKLRPNIDGVVLQYNGRGATYLPQVWEQLPDKQVFLSKLCLKSGSPSDCWMRGAQVFT